MKKINVFVVLYGTNYSANLVNQRPLTEFSPHQTNVSTPSQNETIV